MKILLDYFLDNIKADVLNELKFPSAFDMMKRDIMKMKISRRKKKKLLQKHGMKIDPKRVKK